MKVNQFDKFLSEKSVIPSMVYMHPSVWNGYWSLKRRPKIISVLFRFIGKKLKSRRIYWIGLSIYWVTGLKDFKEFEGVQAEEVQDIIL